MTILEKKKESIKLEARQSKFSVWYMDTQQKPEVEEQDQANGELFTVVENMILKYYAERTILNGKIVTKLMGPWNNTNKNSPWILSVEASDFDNFPTVSQQYTDMNVYKPSDYVYKNGEVGNGNSGILEKVTKLVDASDQLLNGYIFSGAAYPDQRWQSPSGSQLKLMLGTSPSDDDKIYLELPGIEQPILAGFYYIECNGVEWLGYLAPKMISYRSGGHLITEWKGYYTFSSIIHSDPPNFLVKWRNTFRDAIIRNFYIFNNTQRTSNGDWWSDPNEWEISNALSKYYNALTDLINAINSLPPALQDEINYYKGSSSIGGSTETHWSILGGTGTWDNPQDMAIGWQETNDFYNEVTTGNGSGSWTSQLNAHMPSSSTNPGPKYSDSEIQAVNNIANDIKSKINNRINIMENTILGVLNPPNKDGSFGGLREIRYLWVDARLNKSGGSLVQKLSTYSGITILTKKCNLLNDQLKALRIPYDEREPRVEDVNASKMEFPDKIIVSWKMVVQATQYSIYRFDAGSDREYNAPDGPPDNLFTLIATIDAKDSEGLPVTRYEDKQNLQSGHYYFYKIKVHHDGTGFPPPYDANGKSTNPEPATSSLLSLNIYDNKVWRAIVGGQIQIVPGFVNSGAVR